MRNFDERKWKEREKKKTTRETGKRFEKIDNNNQEFAMEEKGRIGGKKRRKKELNVRVEKNNGE